MCLLKFDHHRLHPDTPSATVDAILRNAFGEGNKEFLENNFNTLESKRVAFETLTTPAMVKRIETLGGDAIENYEKWVVGNFSQFMRTEVNELSRSNVSDDDSVITFDPVSSTFHADFSSVPDPLIGVPGTFKGSNPIEATANANVDRAVRDLNRFLPKMRQALKLSGMSDDNISNVIQQQLNLMELDLDPANKQGSLITRMKKAIVDVKQSLQSNRAPSILDKIDEGPNEGFENEPSRPPTRAFDIPVEPSSATNVTGVEGSLLDAISGYESRRDGYNAVNRGVINGLTNLTINEVIQATRRRKGPTGEGGPGDPSTAAGRYQILNSTMAGLIANMGLTGEEKFDEDMQDRMAIELLKGRGLDQFLNGTVDEVTFLKGLQNEWTGLRAGTAPMLELLRQIRTR